MPAGDWYPVQKDYVEEGQRIPENDQRNERAEGNGNLSILLENNDDGQQQGDYKKTDAVEPSQPVAYILIQFHRGT